MSATTVIRAEFQLVSAAIDFTSASGIVVTAGTVYGRLYFPEGCEVTGSFKGTILKDSWATGAPYSATRKNRAIEFLATPEVYSTLYKSCAKSNLPFNRIRTHSLLEACFAAPAVTPVISTPVLVSTPATVQATTVPAIRASFQVCLPAAPVVTPPAIFASDWTTEELYKCSVKQLKVIAAKLNVKVYGTKAEIIAKIQAH